MLWRGRNALTFGRGTPCSLAFILPCGVGGITSLSLTASGGANLGEGCRDFVRRQNRGIRKICGGRRLKSQDRCLFNRAERVMDGCLLWLS